MHLPVRPLRGRWPARLERRLTRFFWADPAVILAPDATPDAYRSAMSALHVGATIKITGAGRHPAADALVTEHLDTSDAAIVDIGASDGSTSVDLIHRLGRFRSYTIADLYLYVDAIRTGRHLLLDSSDGELILVCGPRLVAWPSLSRAVRIGYRPLAAWIRRRGTPSRVLLLNPAARDLIARDPRVGYQVHDVFTPWPGPPPDLIKVANLLRRLYFDDDHIRAALAALHASLPDGGHLLVVDNPRIAGIGERGGLYRRAGDWFERVASTPDRPEIDDLVTGPAPRPGSEHPDVPGADRLAGGPGNVGRQRLRIAGHAVLRHRGRSHQPAPRD